MVEDDAVVVVDQLSLVAELDRFPEPALSDRPGVGIVQGACQVFCVSKVVLVIGMG
jgi:hypothetical protein